ncbi:hypothetical protein LCGC14_1045130, partial [marine sediment metagenome]
KGNFYTVNKTYCERLGYTREELLKLTPRDICTLEYADLVSSRILEVKEKGFNIFETAHKTKDGRVIPVEISSRSIQYDNKPSILSIVRDITERKKAEQKSKESEKILLDLIEAVPIGISISTPEGKFIECNSEAYTISGFASKEEFLNIPALELYHEPKDRERFVELHEKGLVKNFVVKLKRKDGSAYWSSITSTEQKIGKQISYINTFQDVSEHKEAELKLKESESKYKYIANELEMILDHLPLIVAYKDNKNNLLRVNQFYAEAHNLQKEDMEGKSAFEFYPQELAQSYLDDDLKVIMSKQPKLNYIEQWESEQGSRWVSTSKIPYIDEEGNVQGIIAIIEDITEKKLAEEKLKESEEQYRVVLDSINDPIHVVDTGLSIILINPAFKEWVKIFDISPDILGKKVFEAFLFLPDLVLDEYQQVFSTGKTLKTSGKTVINNKEVFTKTTKIPIFSEGKVNQIITIVRDITERKKAEEKLKESEKKLRGIMASITDQVSILDRNLNLLYLNKVVEEIYGPSALGSKCYQIYQGFDEPCSDCQVRRTFEDGEVHHKECLREIRGDSRYIWSVSSVFETDKEERPILVIEVSRDVTERKEKEKEIFDLAQFPSEDPYPILRVNRNGVMYINEAGQKLLNLKDNDQIPKIFQENVKVTFESNQITESEIELDGRNYSFTITPVKDADYVNIYGMDITERKHVEEKLKEVNKLKSEFLRRASHELKTPLISIKGFSDLILSLYADQLDTPIVSKIREINDGCERLQNIINNLLKTSRLESPDLRPKVQKEDLSFLIKFCVNELQPLAERRKQSIKLDIHNELYANIEKEEIHDVLSNLLTNAIKYTPPMGKIEVKTELKEDSVVVSISDNGIGFTEEQKKKIFQQFGKIERYGQGLDLGIDGTGLGLYISKRIVESHSGKIWMESAGKNKGASFYFTLPTAK